MARMVSIFGQTKFSNSVEPNENLFFYVFFSKYQKSNRVTTVHRKGQMHFNFFTERKQNAFKSHFNSKYIEKKKYWPLNNA